VDVTVTVVMTVVNCVLVTRAEAENIVKDNPKTINSKQPITMSLLYVLPLISYTSS